MIFNVGIVLFEKDITLTLSLILFISNSISINIMTYTSYADMTIYNSKRTFHSQTSDYYSYT